MDPFAVLKSIALRQSRDGEFPDWLLAEVLTIAAAPEQYAAQQALVQVLSEQIDNYDPYAGAGCFNSGVSLVAIQATMRQLAAPG